jgi:hypothetical protein
MFRPSLSLSNQINRLIYPLSFPGADVRGSCTAAAMSEMVREGIVQEGIVYVGIMP